MKAIFIILAVLLAVGCVRFTPIEQLPGTVPDHVQKGLEGEPDENCSFLFGDVMVNLFDGRNPKDVFTGDDVVNRYEYAKLKPGPHALGVLGSGYRSRIHTTLNIRFEKAYIYSIEYTGGREFIIRRMKLDGTGLETRTINNR